jgi:hypothetical protein
MRPSAKPANDLRKDHDGQLAAGEILLTGNVLVASDEEIKSGLFGSIEERTVIQRLPFQIVGARYLMSAKEPGQWHWSIGVEQDLHAAAVGCSRELLVKARTSCTCSRLTEGNHSKNSSTVEP